MKIPKIYKNSKVCYNLCMLPNKICKISIILIITSLFASCGISPSGNKLLDMAAMEGTENPSINGYKYMINRISNKVHTFECGNSRIRS